LDIPEGIHWFEGTNGSGKSTFFRTVAGIIPFVGEMSLGEIPNNKESAITYRRLINYAYAEPQYPDYLSGADIIEFVRETRNGNKVQVGKLAEQFGVKEFYKNAMQTYSSGMLKKISLITAFIGRPKLILLDEPFTTIDAQTSDLLYGLINESHAEGISFFIASHQALDASKVIPNYRFVVSEGTIRFAQ
jgi:ABC-2 type transport system ATP-binding protein